MSSFLAQTVQLPDHALFGVVWDADHNQHLMRLSPAAQLYLTTPDARALYISLGVSLASRGAIAPPADLAGRLEVLARMLRWANQAEFAEQVEEILAAFAPVAADGPARLGEPDRLTHRLADCGYPDGCTGCVADHRDISECTEVCNSGNCQLQHGLADAEQWNKGESGTALASWEQELLDSVEPADPARYCGRGKDGAAHCDDCARVGHVAAHPDLGCGDVGCVSMHGDDPAPTRPLPVDAALDGADR